MADSTTKNIVILGASFSGLSVAHYFLKHILPSLPASSGPYHVYLINPSDSFYWRIGAPRVVVSNDLLPISRSFYPIADGFTQYGSDRFTFIQGTATSLDTSARTVTVVPCTEDGAEQHDRTRQLPYYALVIATGTRTPSKALSTHTTTKVAKDAIADLQTRLPRAKTVLIAGGGPAGVETAGEIGEQLNGRAGFAAKRPGKTHATITLVAGGSRLLSALRPALAKTAEGYLNKVGVDVIYNVKMESATPTGDGKTEVRLSNGETRVVDVFIPATGVEPNTEFLPAHLKNEKGYVKTNPSTLRVDEAGPRVYCLGDVGTYTRGGVMDIYDAVPVIMTNISRDLHAAVGSEKNNGLPTGKDRAYKPNLKETQLVPVGRSVGVGAVFGWKLPSTMVWAIKGRDYLTGAAPSIQMGTKWKKDAVHKWTPVDA
ncbi:hypothetical protein H2201_003146 [Coniosporium apollinis]|uniref:FAD/NAD(P)-binding domain-containing protein n=1 Tax=Coniosporium apollinis TaxID=61459 RepID=A0ABQ9P2Z4_9PEZI|nr:hypothetical protein H2201_003146 [Coniosporium apollinis]